MFIHLSELHIELTDASVPVSLNELHGARDLGRVSGEETLDDGFNTWVAKREHLLPRREDDNGDFSTTESAKFTGLFEQPRPAFREGDLKIALVGHLHHLHLLTTFVLPRHGCCC